MAHQRTTRKGSTPKKVYPVIDTLVDAGLPVKKKYCEVLGVSLVGYNLTKNRPLRPRKSVESG